MIPRIDRKKAALAGIRLTEADAAIVKGMLLRGDRQSDIASCFGVNQGEIAKIKNGSKHPRIVASPLSELPAPGPYKPVRDYLAYAGELERVRSLLVGILADIDQRLAEAQTTGADHARGV